MARDTKTATEVDGLARISLVGAGVRLDGVGAAVAGELDVAPPTTNVGVAATSAG